MSLQQLTQENYIPNVRFDKEIALNGGCYIGHDTLKAKLFTYEEAAFSWKTSGAIVANLTGHIIQLNNQVTINFDGFYGSSLGALNIGLDDGTIPLYFRPPVEVVCPIGTLSNSTHLLGFLIINTNGGMVIYGNGSGAPFSASGNCGIIDGAISYSLVLSQ